MYNCVNSRRNLNQINSLILEYILIDFVTKAIEETGSTNIVFSGGIFLNMIMNMKIQQKFGDKINLFFNPKICSLSLSIFSYANKKAVSIPEIL